MLPMAQESDTDSAPNTQHLLLYVSHSPDLSTLVGAAMSIGVKKGPSDFERITAERDLYLRLLQLGDEKYLGPLLKEALALIVELAETRQGYIEIHDEDDPTRPPRWWIAHGFSQEEVDGVRAALSRGIIAEALATGETIVTPSALLDPRFNQRDSVRLGRIEAVMCAPIGEDPPRGVLYLQGRGQSGMFSDDERTRAELFVRHLAPLVDRLLMHERRKAADDPTQTYRRILRLDGIVGRSPALAALFRQVAAVVPLDVTVLLTGDCGTGKSQLARVIHDNGPRVAQPFVELNCASLPDTLVESELFGALPGAHSTATRKIEGKVAAAEHGTLFLDEIGELSIGTQAKLLQLLQGKEYYPLGGTRPVRADVRVIAACNIDLQRAVAEHRFREDLYYRLHVLPVRVPTLAERRQDITELASYFCASACERHNLQRVELSRNVLRAIEATEWPGNVRQLMHAIEAAVVRAAGEGARQIELSYVFPEQDEDEVSALRKRPTFQEATRQFQVDLLCDALEETGWNVNETARRLDLARSHVYNLIRAYKIRPRK
jgi:Nif-specific regulatory protein